MGTPDFAVPVLAALLDGGHEVAGVYTQPDRPRGRGNRPAASPISGYARDRDLQVLQPASLRPKEAQDGLSSLAPDLVVVAAYGLILPRRTLELPPLGCLNVHPSLLPRYRGPSPVSSTILNSDAVTGVTIIRLDEGVDTGPILASRETAVTQGENAQELTARLFEMGAALLMDIVPQWATGERKVRPQDDAHATTTSLLRREDGQIDWRRGADHIARQVLAYHPWPGTFTRWRGKLLKIMEASPAQWEARADAPPGLVMPPRDGGLVIATGEGVLEVQRLQMEGRRALGHREFLKGHPDFVGSIVG